jgi:hypothetical protein
MTWCRVRCGFLVERIEHDATQLMITGRLRVGRRCRTTIALRGACHVLSRGVTHPSGRDEALHKTSDFEHVPANLNANLNSKVGVQVSGERDEFRSDSAAGSELSATGLRNRLRTVVRIPASQLMRCFTREIGPAS